MSRYAEDTSVPIERSKAEIEKILLQHGATTFASGWDAGAAYIGFEMKSRKVRFVLEMPNRQDKRFWLTPGRGLKRTEGQAYAEWEQACRQSWRALFLVVRAKLEAVEAKISTFEQEFLAHIILPSGETVGSWLGPQLDEAYKRGAMPPLLPAPKDKR